MTTQNSFKVGFEDKQGLDKIVDLVMSDAKGEFVLAEHEQYGDPIGQIRVTLRPNVAVSGRAGYVLDAKIFPTDGNKLVVNPQDYSGFAVRGLEPISAEKTYLLGSGILPEHSTLFVFQGLPANGLSVSLTGVNGREEQGLPEFARALENTVTSAYRSAGKTVPERTLVLAVANSGVGGSS